MVFSANVEFGVLFYLILSTLTFHKAAIFQLAVYFAFFKLRYNTSQFTRHAVKQMEVRVDGLVSHPSVPPFVKQTWISGKRIIAQVSGPLLTGGKVGQSVHTVPPTVDGVASAAKTK